MALFNDWLQIGCITASRTEPARSNNKDLSDLEAQIDPTIKPYFGHTQSQQMGKANIVFRFSIQQLI